MSTQKEYVEKLTAQMREWDAEIEQLKDKAAYAIPARKQEYAQAIAPLVRKRNEAAVQLKEIAAAGSGEWKELKEGAEQTWNEVKTILHNALSTFRH